MYFSQISVNNTISLFPECVIQVKECRVVYLNAVSTVPSPVATQNFMFRVPAVIIDPLHVQEKSVKIRRVGVQGSM